MATRMTTATGSTMAARAVTTPSSMMRCHTGRSDTPGPTSPPSEPKGTRPEPLASWLAIHGTSA